MKTLFLSTGKDISKKIGCLTQWLATRARKPKVPVPSAAVSYVQR